MSDAELRSVERELSVNPISLELRRRHARLLQRTGDEEGALSAIDTAWRLGGEDLFEELTELLEERAIDLGDFKLRYVPGGPFVMGIDDFDDDAAPPHLVQLPPFWISEECLTYSALRNYQGEDTWLQRMIPHVEDGGFWATFRLTCDLNHMEELLRDLGQRLQPGGRVGRFSLPSEAQWERATRAALLRPDGTNPYGLAPDDGPQWTSDNYHPRYYQVSPGYDPQGPGAGAERVVRGVPSIPPSHYAIYREGATPSGNFRILEDGSSRMVRVEGGLGARAVFRCR